jgi:Fe-S-cluster containining protein
MKTKEPKFKCKERCGECCGVIPVPRDFFDGHLPQVKRPIKKFMYDNMGRVWAFTWDGKCIYLDSKMICSIYDERPAVCRRFGIDESLPCPYIESSGKPRSPESEKLAKEKLDALVEDAKRRSPPA